MSVQKQKRSDSLSPISRRAFFLRAGRKALGLGGLASAVAATGGRCDVPLPMGSGGYYELDDYLDADYYSDFGYYEDVENCGYCDGPGRAHSRGAECGQHRCGPR